MTISSKKPDSMPSFPMGILGTAFAITIVTLLWLGFFAYSYTGVFNKIITHDFKAISLRGEIMLLDEVLTMSALMSASTGDLKWEKRYNQYDPVLSKAITEAGNILQQSNYAESAKQTDEANIKLVAMERQSFDLVKQGQLKEAQAIINGEEYKHQKQIYASGMTKFGDLLNTQAYSNLQKIIVDANKALIIILVTLFIQLAAWIMTYKSIIRWRAALEQALALQKSYQAALEEERTHLEKRVEDRTQELSQKNTALIDLGETTKQLHNQLVVAARRAGMADISTSVVHNIGNVLNSVNVSALELTDRVAHSKMTKLSNLSAMLKQHEHDLPAFLTTDPNGKNIPQFIELLTTFWKQEQNAMINDLHSVNKNIAHIKDIIDMQQAMSGDIAQSEEIAVSELLDEALILHKTECTRDNIIITRDYQLTKSIIIDRVKLLQIVVNLIKNAIEAMESIVSHNKRISITSTLKDDSRFIITVADNGKGIPPEAFEKLFNYGFTTKKTGHGFGLHMSAIAAKGMGGSLIAENNPHRNGARFILELPLVAPVKKSKKIRPDAVVAEEKAE